MKKTPKMLRTAILALSASVVLPTAPVFGQDAAAPPPVVTLSPPPPVITAPPPAAAAPAVPAPRIDIVPRTAPVTRAAPPPAARAAPRAATRTRVAAPVRTAAPAPAPAPAAEPVATAPVAGPPPRALQPAPPPAVPVAAAAAAVPAVAEESSVEDAAQSDVDALAADSAPVSGRPWLEFLMRPVRAGTSQDETIVQFELTVGNTGTVAARDVRISTWMFAGNEGSDMERSLITPPAGATISEVDIEAGDGTRVDGEISMPKSDRDTVLPVVHADARYRLPDGTEGRTSASFSVGLPEGDGISPFQLDRATGLIETVEARLYGEPERV
jgi:hypothetical protein